MPAFGHDRDPDTPLTAREEAFVAAYIASGFTDPQAAGLVAGYAKSRVHVMVYELLGRPNVAKAVAEAQERVRRAAEHKAGVTLADVVSKLAQVGLFDVRKLFTPTGAILPVDQWPDDVSAAVAGLESVEQTDIEGNPAGLLRKVKLLDRTKALDMLMKHLGGYETDNKQRSQAGADAVQELVRAIQRVSGDECRLPIASQAEAGKAAE